MSVTRLQVANGFYEVLRKKFVEDGYFPDIENYTDPDDQDGFQSAKDAIIQGGKQLIEVFNLGNYKSRDVKNTNDVVIDLVEVGPSSTGAKSHVEYKEKGGGRYDKLETAESFYDLTFEIRYVAELEQYADIVESAIFSVLGGRRYLDAIDDSGNVICQFAIQQVTSFDVSGDDFIERGYRYQALFIDLEGDKVVGQVNELEEFVFEQKTSEEDPKQGGADYSFDLTP